MHNGVAKIYKEEWPECYEADCKTQYGEVPIAALSLGYRTTMGLFVDIAWGLFTKYDKYKDPLACPAIVLIDEIDLHLHPKWQRKIIKDLSTHFPNTQFIATAHSPLVVQSSHDANLVVAINDGDHIQIENNPEFLKEWRVDQILTSELFGISSARSEEIEKMINDRNSLLGIKRNKAQESRLKVLDAKIQNLPTTGITNDPSFLELIKYTANAIKKSAA